jgi:hypothetical protein
VLVLHASWLDDALLLWAERWPAAAPSPAAPWSPWDPGADALRRAWQSVMNAPCSAEAVPCTAWLPTAGGRPVPSRASWQHAAAAPAAWRVTALPLDSIAVMDLLGACRERRRLADGVVAGADLIAWAELHRFAGALVARARFLPALLACGDRHESRWVPAFDGADRQRLFQLAARLPGAACCLSRPHASVVGSPAAAAEAFTAEAVDRLVRFAAVTTLSRAHASKGRYFSAHDAWLAALRGDGRVVRWDNARELASLAQEIEAWRRPVDLGSRSPWRLVLRLEEPAETDPGAWFVRYLAQPFDRPEALQTLSALAGGAASELALTSLGQAASLCPLLAQNGAATAGCRLTTGEAHVFLTLHAPLLEAAGFGVLAPPGLRGGASRPRLELLAQASSGEAPAGGVCSLAALVSVDWQLALGGEPVTIAELEQLTSGGGELVRFRGRWIELDGRQVGEILRLWRRRTAEARSAGDLVRMMIGVDQEAHGVRIGGVDAHGWLRDLINRLRGETAPEELPPPAGFRGELRPYQCRGYAWLAFLREWGLGACLADDMGLGKTIQALALVARERERGERRPVLLVCPTSVIGNWQHEAARFTPGLAVLRHHGPERAFGETFAEEAAEHALVVTNYALLPRDYASLRRVAWAGVILDEAQNIKNPDTRQAQAARALSADYRFALTGTPVENHVGDLWSIMDFLNPGLLGTRTAFRDRFVRPIQAGTDPAGRERLRRATAPFVLRRLKTDRAIIADLPEKVEGKVYCPLTREQASLYAAVLRGLEDALGNATGIARRGLVLAALTHLKQVCNHPAHYLHEAGAADNGRGLAGRSGKLARLGEMLEEVVESGDRALVFTQFTQMGALLQEHLGQRLGLEPLFLHGGVPARERERMVAAFQADDGPPVFLLSLRAGGTGLNLTRACHVFHYDRWWNPAVENQATDRAFRIGQTRNVMVHKFICAGTLEDRIDAMITQKTAVAEAVVGSGETWLTELSDEELKEALALAPGAVMEDGEEEGEVMGQ